VYGGWGLHRGCIGGVWEVNRECMRGVLGLCRGCTGDEGGCIGGVWGVYVEPAFEPGPMPAIS